MAPGSAAFASCHHDPCAESAISFSPYCWEHTEQGAYVKNIHAQLKALTAQSPTVLNLKRVSADGVDFSGKDLSNSNLDQVHFTHSNLVGSKLEAANMVGARFGFCDFVGADLSRANLTRATLLGCSFSYADLHEAYLIETILKDTDFMGAALFDAILWNADLAGAKHLKKKNFQNSLRSAREGRTHISEKNPTVSHESYRALKHYFYHNGLHEDAGWAAYRERIMERRHFFNTKDLRYLPSLLMDLLSGYTEKPFRVILSSLVIILTFAFLYYFMDATRSTAAGHLGRTDFWNCLYFSFVTFTTVGYGDFVPRPEIWYKIPACIEAFSGPFMAGLYIFTLTRRYAAG